MFAHSPAVGIGARGPRNTGIVILRGAISKSGHTEGVWQRVRVARTAAGAPHKSSLVDCFPLPATPPPHLPVLIPIQPVHSLDDMI